MKTYVVEDVNKQVIEYCHTLRAAKYIAVSYGGYRIYSLQGDYFGYVATDLALSSANDAIKAWGYQAGFKGGSMERIEDTIEAFETFKENKIKYWKPLF